MKIIKTQNWRLLRYLNDIFIKLYKNDDRIRYTQYNISWPLLNRIRWAGAKIKSFSAIMAKKLHMSASSFVTLCFPYILFCLKKNNLDSTVLENFSELLEKEMNLTK